MENRSHGDAFRFRAGRPSLDLCSTLLSRHRAAKEQLRNPADLTRWIAESGLAPAPSITSAAMLRAALSLREAVYRMAHARLRGEPFALGDVATVNAAASAARAVPRIRTDGRLSWSAANPARAALAAVARDAIDLLAGPLAGRIRECAAADCAFLFVDTSRAGNRRWCAMNRCGNRQHVRDHRKRDQVDSRPFADRRGQAHVGTGQACGGQG